MCSWYGVSTIRESLPGPLYSSSPCTISGRSSKPENRTSLKRVRAGAARFKPATSVCAFGFVVVAGSGAARDGFGQIALAIDRASVIETFEIPEVMPVEPVVGILPHMVFEPRGVTLRGSAQLSLAGMARQHQLVGERFEVKVVAIAAAIHADADHHRNLEQCADQERRGGKRGRRAHEIDDDGRFMLARAIREQRHQRAFARGLAKCEHDLR